MAAPPPTGAAGNESALAEASAAAAAPTPSCFDVLRSVFLAVVSWRWSDSRLLLISRLVSQPSKKLDDEAVLAKKSLFDITLPLASAEK